jgi:hypothetical protein
MDLVLPSSKVHDCGMVRSPIRRLAPLAVVLAVFAAACGGSDSKESPSPSSTSSTSTTSATTSTTATTATTTTTIPVAATSSAVWPTTNSAVRYRDPVAAARGFAINLAHFRNPIVGAFRQGDARSGEVPVRATPRGPETTVFVRQLGAGNSWWVLGSSTPNIVMQAPTAGATITSPVSLRGTSTAFEATVNYALNQDDRAAPLKEGIVMGGANGDMGPYSASVMFPQPVSARGSLVMYTVSAESGNVAEASVVRVAYR